MAGDEAEEEGDLEEGDLAEGQLPPLWQRGSFWRVVLPLLVTVAAVTLGLLLQLVEAFHFHKTVRSGCAVRGAGHCPLLQSWPGLHQQAAGSQLSGNVGDPVKLQSGLGRPSACEMRPVMTGEGGGDGNGSGIHVPDRRAVELFGPLVLVPQRTQPSLPARVVRAP